MTYPALPPRPPVEFGIQQAMDAKVAYYVADGWTVQYRAQYNAVLHKRGLTAGGNAACIAVDVVTIGGFILIHAILWFASTRKLQLWVDARGVVQTGRL